MSQETMGHLIIYNILDPDTRKTQVKALCQLIRMKPRLDSKVSQRDTVLQPDPQPDSYNVCHNYSNLLVFPNFQKRFYHNKQTSISKHKVLPFNTGKTKLSLLPLCDPNA